MTVKIRFLKAASVHIKICIMIRNFDKYKEKFGNGAAACNMLSEKKKGRNLFLRYKLLELCVINKSIKKKLKRFVIISIKIV